MPSILGHDKAFGLCRVLTGAVPCASVPEVRRPVLARIVAGYIPRVKICDKTANITNGSKPPSSIAFQIKEKSLQSTAPKRPSYRKTEP